MKKLFLLFLLTNISSFAQISEQWKVNYSSKGDYSAKYTCIAKDKFGNFYVGGYLVAIDNNRDYLVAKLNSNGDSLWTRSFRGTDNSADEVNAIAVDKNANVYITGFANGQGTGNDILTIKLNTNGDTLWKRFYNHTANDDDNGNSIAVDTLGNVFVTGESDGNSTSVDNSDYITIKYDASGNLLWSNRYGITGTDRAEKVLTDLLGNCYVTGRAYNGSNDNYATIKYNSAGVQQWVKTYDGGSDDRAQAMAIDSSYAFIYVTGRSDNSSNDDIVTLKYSVTAGTLSWTKVYNNVDDDRGVSITVDAAANIYVSGESDGDASGNRNWNFVTIKYASTSVQQWVRSFNSNASNEDTPIEIYAASSGDVYVCGQSDIDANATTTNFNITTLKYNSAGTLQWTKTFAGNAVATGGAEAMLLANNGFLVVVGSAENSATQKDAYAIQYDPSGAEMWIKSYEGSGDNSDNAFYLNVDASENSYIAGFSINQETDRNMTSAKINSIGDTLWVRKYNGTSTVSIDAANALVTDASGNVFVTGFTKNTGASNDFNTIKYNSNGDSIWVKRYNNALVNGSDKAYSIAQDASGNTYVCGFSETNNTGITDDFLTIKYTASGVQQWLAKFNGTANGEDRAYFIKVGATKVFVCGRSWNGVNFDYALQVYTHAGSPAGSGFYDGLSGDDVPTGMEIDAAENVYITGRSASPLNSLTNDYVTVKFNGNGILQWARRYNGSTNGNDEASGIALDNNANVFVTGETDEDPLGIAASSNFATIAYNSSGDSLWTQIFNGSSNLNDDAKAITVDSYGNCFVTGEVDNGNFSQANIDIVTIKYSPLGVVLVTAVYAGQGNGKDSPNAIVVRNDNVYIAGESYVGSIAQKDIVVIKYDGFTLGKFENTNPTSALKVYPNPADEFFQVDFSGVNVFEKNAFFVVYNQLGVEMKRWNLNSNSIHNLSRNSLPNGIYFYKCFTGERIVASGKISFQ
jgi:uncharacterized delta-60 repeat protein